MKTVKCCELPTNKGICINKSNDIFKLVLNQFKAESFLNDLYCGLF
nr:MAG TPA: hypothetical protein [Caudoviricetes sp.]